MANGQSAAASSPYQMVYPYQVINATYVTPTPYTEAPTTNTTYNSSTEYTEPYSESTTTTTTESSMNYTEKEETYADPPAYGEEEESGYGSEHHSSYNIKRVNSLMKHLKGNYHGRIDASNVVVNIVRPAFLPGQSEAESLDALASTLSVLSDGGYNTDKAEASISEQIGQTLLDLIQARPEIADVILDTIKGTQSEADNTTTEAPATEATTLETVDDEVTEEANATTVSEEETEEPTTEAPVTEAPTEAPAEAENEAENLTARFTDLLNSNAREGKFVAESRQLDIEPMQSFPLSVMTMVDTRKQKV